MKRSIQYTPLDSQTKFHEAGPRFKGFSGPVGSGKSAALCQEAIRLAYVNAGRTGLIGAPTFAMLRDSTQAAMTESLQKSGIPYSLNKAENVLTITDVDSRILLRSLDEPERLRGTNLAWFGVDELTYASEDAWVRLEARLRDPKATELCGFAVWTPKGFDWVYRRFIQNPVEGYHVVQARPYENRHLLMKVPDFYERLKKSYDEKFFEQEVLGLYLNPQDGLVYRSFNRMVNVEEMELDPALPIRWALDFNVDPMSSVIVQVSGYEVRVLDEIVLKRASTTEACEAFLKRYGGHRQRLMIYADANAHRMQTTGMSDREMIERCLAEHGVANVDFRIPRGNPPVRDRVCIVNRKLMSASGDVDLKVHPRCKGLIADFESVTYRKDTSEIDKDSDPRLTHLTDAVGYLLWQEYGPKKTIGPVDRRLPGF
jgi:hypothetical protein